MLAFAFGATAQSIGDYMDVVYLKNGSMVKGVIVEQVPGKSIKIKTADGSEFVYGIAEVERFTREETESNHSSNSCFYKARNWANGDYRQKDKGYFAEIGLLGNSSAYAVRVTNGYKFGRLGYLGVGVGLENVALNSGERLPELSLNLIYAGDLMNRKVTPFYQIEAGYGFSLDRYGYNSNLLNGNNFGFGKFGSFGSDDEDFVIDSESASTLNYGGPQGALVLGVKIHTLKKVYFKLGLDARLTSNFSDVHYLTFDDLGQASGSSLVQEFNVNPGIGARFTFGF